MQKNRPPLRTYRFPGLIRRQRSVELLWLGPKIVLSVSVVTVARDDGNYDEQLMGVGIHRSKGRRS